VDLGNRADSLSPEDLYRVTDSIVKLQRSVEGRHRSENGNKPLSISIENACDNAASSIENGEKKSNADIQNKNDGEVEKIVTQFEKEEVAADVIINNLDPSESKKDQAEQLLSQCNHLLSIVAEKASQKISKFTGQDIQRLLQIYVITPVQADVVVDAIGEEVNTRVSALEIAASTYSGSVQDLVRHAADSSVEAATALSTFSSAEEKLSASFMKGMKSLFDKPGNKEDDETATKTTSSAEDVARQVNRAAASSCKAAARLERVGKGALINAEKTLRDVEESAAFELGRCQELIAAYRRLEFKTGTRKTRYDEERRRDMGKRILTRLFQ